MSLSGMTLLIVLGGSLTKVIIIALIILQLLVVAEGHPLAAVRVDIAHLFLENCLGD
jgi:hypothetical protein